MSGINIDYNKTDFLYYKYGYDENGSELYNCNNNEITSLSLTASCNLSLPDSNGPCSKEFIEKICDNKQHADKLLAKTMNHSGADELYKNTTSQFNVERMSFINLGIGIIASVAFIIKYKI